MFSGFSCLTQEHDLRLVGVALVICGLGTFSTVSLLNRAEGLRPGDATSWLIAAAAVFGCSIWSLHFIAMLAFMRQLPISYNVSMTVASVAIAVAGSLAAFLTWHLAASRTVGIILGGTILGLAVAGMHYTGVAAMRLNGSFTFNQSDVGVSIVCGLGFATLALARTRGAHRLRQQAEASLWLSLSIITLHFIGMAALRITLGPVTQANGAMLGSGTLAILVGTVSFALLIVTLAATAMERHLAERTIRDFRRMRLLNDLAHEVMIIHRDGIVLEVNSAGSRLFGMPINAIIGMPVARLFAENSVPVLSREPGAEAAPEETMITTATGKDIPVAFSARIIEFDGTRATAVALRDLSDQKRDEARIEHLAQHDRLTDLPGRFLLRERLGRAVEAAIEDHSRVAVLNLNLDRFKPINDVIGYAGGDAVLIEVARRLKGALRATDSLARVGGDEFVIVLAKSERPGKVSTFASRLLAEIEGPFVYENRSLSIGASIGIAMYPGDGADADALLRAAVAAVDSAKQAAPGSIRFFEASMDADLFDRRQLEQDLWNAAERGEMHLVYQPVADCRTGMIGSFEALLRWQHPQRGLIPPASFIPLAEESGAISRIGHWTIDAACAAAAAWPVPRGVAVNVSPSQFRSSDVPAIVAAALARTGLNPSRLEIEITEGVFIDDADRAVTVLTQLRALGVRLALDDFGTGYSALSYLRLFRFDKIKIDQSFVRDLGLQEEAATIIKAIIGLGHNLGLIVTVEGVETEQQLAQIRAQGADMVQGYLISRPARSDSFTEPVLAQIGTTFFPQTVDGVRPG